MHKRELIRKAAKEALTGLDITQSRVFTSRVYPMEKAALPGLIIYTLEEESEPSTMQKGLKRSLNLMVEVYVKEIGGNVDDKLDAIAEDVEDAINEDPKLDGNALFTYLETTEIEYNAESDKPVGTMKMNFKVEYLT